MVCFPAQDHKGLVWFAGIEDHERVLCLFSKFVADDREQLFMVVVPCRIVFHKNDSVTSSLKDFFRSAAVRAVRASKVGDEGRIAKKRCEDAPPTQRNGKRWSFWCPVSTIAASSSGAISALNVPDLIMMPEHRSNSMAYQNGYKQRITLR